MGGLDSRANDLLKAQRREILLSGEGFQRANSINASLTQIGQQHRRTSILAGLGVNAYHSLANGKLHPSLYSLPIGRPIGQTFSRDAEHHRSVAIVL